MTPQRRSPIPDVSLDLKEVLGAVRFALNVLDEDAHSEAESIARSAPPAIALRALVEHWRRHRRSCHSLALAVGYLPCRVAEHLQTKALADRIDERHREAAAAAQAAGELWTWVTVHGHSEAASVEDIDRVVSP